MPRAASSESRDAGSESVPAFVFIVTAFWILDADLVLDY